MGEIFQVLIRNGHKLEDLKFKYTVDQVNLFYEKELKKEMDSNKMEAIIVANAVTYGSPSWSKDGASGKNRMWKSFMDSLTWDSLQERGRKQTVGDIKKMAKGAGVIALRGKGDK